MQVLNTNFLVFMFKYYCFPFLKQKLLLSSYLISTLTMFTIMDNLLLKDNYILITPSFSFDFFFSHFLKFKDFFSFGNSNLPILCILNFTIVLLVIE